MTDGTTLSLAAYRAIYAHYKRKVYAGRAAFARQASVAYGSEANGIAAFGSWLFHNNAIHNGDSEGYLYERELRHGPPIELIQSRNWKMLSGQGEILH